MLKELAHDGNFNRPDKVPAVPPNAEAGQHWRLGVDPAAKGAIHHDSNLTFESTARVSTDSYCSACGIDRHSFVTAETSSCFGDVSATDPKGEADMVEYPTPRQADYLWDEGPDMVECPTSRQADDLWDEVADMVECPTPRQADYFEDREGRSSSGGVQRRGNLAGERMDWRMSVMSAASTESWSSRYSCMTDGRRYSAWEDEGYLGSDRLSVRYM